MAVGHLSSAQSWAFVSEGIFFYESGELLVPSQCSLRADTDHLELSYYYYYYYLLVIISLLSRTMPGPFY